VTFLPHLHIASEDDVRKGKTTDIYFVRTKQILDAKGLSGRRVVAEVTASSLPKDWRWAVLCGIEEEIALFEGRNVDIYAMPEGTIIKQTDHRHIREPVMIVDGPYGEFCELETPLLGLICQASGVATMAARVRKAAGKKLLISFGIRRAHPALSPMIDRAAYIGGFDGVSSLKGAEIIGKQPTGTMPHALILVMGDQVAAWKAFDEVMPPEIPRIALVDTLYDEKIEAVLAAEALGSKLDGVRLDTPSSRRGNFAEIVREVRWELDARGFERVKIIASGGFDEARILELGDAPVDGFGVGTSISNAPTVDFAMDIVEIEGRPIAKRGKLGGRKQVFRCANCFVDIVKLSSAEPPTCPKCGGMMTALLKPFMMAGKIVTKTPSPDEIRESVLRQLDRADL